ncbi:hypothetical protein BEH_07980 [Priestia filamentosa]|uniref:Uncharacterized protein n=1 Tax=Priestia filamentosa TaxID=1402861 RepID=A0A0H4KD39_9BACI|nr:hypothetical protein [Priestia filamentosa]AKO92042.1 hypothetical protein BEH_07980 [Priestia filamentosa]
MTTTITIGSNNKNRKLTREVERLKIYEKQSLDKRASHIDELWEYFMDINSLNIPLHKLHKTSKKYKRINEKYLRVIFQLFLYGSDTAINKFIEFRRKSANGIQNKKEFLETFAVFIQEYRKDLGLPETKVTHEHFLDLMLNDKEKYWG